jgi:phage shock protein A
MDTSKIKSFWEKPQGTTGMIAIGAIAVVGGMAILSHLDQLIALAQNTIYFGSLLGFIFIVTSLLMNRKFRFLCSSMFQSLMTKITGIWIAVDPIGILKNYLIDMKDKMKRIAQFITNLAGQVGKVERDISERTKKIDKYMGEASAAKRLGDPTTAALKSNFAAREVAFIERRTVSLEKMKKILENLKKMEKGLDFLYLDTENQVTMLTDEYESVKEAYKATKGAEELINGDDAKALFDQTCQHVTDKVGTWLGEMDRFMEQAQGSFADMDLNNEVFNEKGLDMLANWEKSGVLSYESGQLGKSSTKFRVPSDGPSTDELEAAQMEQSRTGDRPSSFSKIFNK